MISGDIAIPFYFLMCPTTFMSITGVNMGSIPIILSIIFSQKPILLKKIFSAIFSHFSYEEKTDDKAQLANSSSAAACQAAVRPYRSTS